jgi:hypothetical protein
MPVEGGFPHITPSLDEQMDGSEGGRFADESPRNISVN